MSWEIFALLAALTWGVLNIFDKFFLDKWVKDSFVLLVAFSVMGLLTALGIYFFHGFLPMPTWNIWLCLSGGTIYLLANWLYFLCVQREEVSKVISLLYLDPLYTAILAALLLNEILSPVKYLGIALLVIGAFLISTNKLRISLRQEASRILLFTPMVFAVCNILNKISFSHGDFLTAFAYIRVGGFFGLLCLLPFHVKSAAQEFRLIGAKSSLLFLNEGFVLVGALFYALAISKGQVSLANALTAVQPLVVLIFATLVSYFYPEFIKEKIDRKTVALKLAAVVAIILGVILVS